MSFKKPCYIWDPLLISQSDRLPAVPFRASMVNDLLTAYELNNNLQVIRSTPASYDDLKKFHSELYLDHLKSFHELEEDYMTNDQDEEYGIGYDCPPISNMYELVTVVAGGSITAAKCLLLGITNVAINWCGGWHHAQRFGAEGFCYVNDIVLAIEKLRLKFKKILYIDLDVHHGNGVQDAYKLSKSVFTLSFHKYEPGFYPGSGNIDDVGSLTGKGYSCNFPLHAFYTDKTLVNAFANVFPLVNLKFEPDAIVMQCGADGLVIDPHGGACLTDQGYITCLHKVLATEKPILLLGGGGYNHPNAARLWTKLTAVAAGVDLDDNIPEHDHWPKYGPDYILSIQPSLTKDLNTEQYINECISQIKCNLELLDTKTAIYLPLKRKQDQEEDIKIDSEFKIVEKQDSGEGNLKKETRLKPVKAQLVPEKDNKADVYDFQD
ncbi:PREDICTED: histone deacetylase 8-like isoform X1 [Papilio xuthus]|uniref:Histone deacetylase n=1 Tax=Papilio xuthus TaxID=66420 RepID=A0AAJ7E9A1_PAPXU|nr:PREDICTED: histone deacetylase 8-like isoform X1 [Papilio xuthus]XP_013167899.1 PREDICTED: histone deacetylase 8-like isoform X1 [Papilio xuthus]